MQSILDLLSNPAVTAVLGGLLANIITPFVRRIPAANALLILIRAILSGVPTETPKAPAQMPPKEEVKS
jgi:hypothetical protein